MSVLRALFAILAFVLGVDEACAHATLVSTAPQDGAVLAEPPEEAVLHFDEPVSILVVRLLDDTGAAVVLPAAPRTEGGAMRVTLPPRMREGTLPPELSRYLRGFPSGRRVHRLFDRPGVMARARRSARSPAWVHGASPCALCATPPS